MIAAAAIMTAIGIVRIPARGRLVPTTRAAAATASATGATASATAPTATAGVLRISIMVIAIAGGAQPFYGIVIIATAVVFVICLTGTIKFRPHIMRGPRRFRTSFKADPA